MKNSIKNAAPFPDISDHTTDSTQADHSIDNQLVLHLRDLSHTMRSLYEGRGSQKRILIILEEIGGSITQQKLTERLGIQPGSASEVLSKLENTGYIRRTPNENDRRTTDIVLTETGKTAAAQARDQRIRRHEEMFSCLSHKEKEELLSLLEKINRDWESRYGERAEKHRENKHSHGKHGHHRDRTFKNQNLQAHTI